MGGFVIQTPNWPLFPIDSKQLFYLVSNGYLPYPEHDKSIIDDKNKADGLSRYVIQVAFVIATLIWLRFIAVTQVLIFSISCIARAIQHLAITTLELTTLGFIFAMLVISYFWRHKPQDIGRPIILKTDTTIAEILLNVSRPIYVMWPWTLKPYQAGDAAKYPYKRTPLDFVSHDEWIISVLWAYYTNLLRKIYVSIFPRRTKVRPVSRIQSDNFPALSLNMEFICGIFMLLYSAIFICAWSFVFPSRTERILWNISSLAMLGFSVVGGVFFLYCDYAHVRSRGREKLTTEQHTPPQRPYMFGNMTKKVAAKIRSLSPDQDPALGISIRLLIPCTILCAIYSIARAYVLIEDIIGLRSLPSSAFETVDWTQFMPHL